MKKLLLSLTMVLAMFAASAQNFTVTEKETGNVVENGASYVVYGDGSESWGYPGGELMLEFDLVANEDMRVICRKIENNVIEGTMNYICFGQCLLPETYETEPIPVSPNDEEPLLFSSHYMASDDYTTVLGLEQSMTYEIWNAANPDEKFVINVIFKYSLYDVTEVTAQNVISAYPTPATDVVNFDYDLSGSVNSAAVVVYNMAGQEVMRSELNGVSGKLSMNVGDLSEGVYFYSLVINGKTEKSNKIVIR